MLQPDQTNIRFVLTQHFFINVAIEFKDNLQSNNEDGNNSSTSDQAGRQNTEALPNPWGGGGNNTNRPASNTTVALKMLTKLFFA